MFCLFIYIFPLLLLRRCHPASHAGVRGSENSPEVIGAALMAYLLRYPETLSNPGFLPAAAVLWIVLQYLTQRWSGAITPLAP